MRTVSMTATEASGAAGSIQRLAIQRQAAALARAHAHAFQIKVAVAVGCSLAGVLGYALHRVSAPISNVDRAALVASSTSTGTPPDVHIGQVQIPYEGDTCRRFHFDNRNGAVMGETFASCGAVESVAQRVAEPTRAEAIMNAFRVAR